ncbi:hypothetical protein HPP92_000747 [Vanilla planifolia]|uniref:UBA domain-containing protein n=1 Tax=Vanilla planifolia TaxID=51239 RepID=A0A835RPS5_VANPL|nr:hypothetical protein HPP92_000747 [Vanilla planifolia]
MSPASKSKSKVKSTQKAAKEQSKGSVKATQVPSNGGNGSTSVGHNPHLTTLKLFETSPLSASSETQSNGRLRTADDQDVNSGSSPTTADYDSISINGSCSGDSEDHKEKITCTAPRTETIPGFDNDKKDKNKLKNERKHQRQKERRAQELHERCIGFLTSRKFEALSHQLIAMGFSSDRANMALIANEGRMEESVAWLLLDGEENKQPTAVDLDDKSNAKIDISSELSRIDEMVNKYKCTKQEVERAVVTCEGDLLKAEESLRVQKQVNKVTELAKLDESADSTVLTNKVPVPNQYSLLTRNSLNGIQQKEREERDLNYTKPIASEPLLHESVYRSLQQSLKRPQPKPATLSSRMHPLATDKRLLASTSMVPVSYSLSSSAVPVSEPLEVPQPLFGLTLGQELKAGFHAGVLKEPIVTQRANQNLPSTAATVVSPPVSAGWHSGSVPSMEMKTSDSVSFGPSLPNIGTGASAAQQYYHRNGSRPESFDTNQYYGLSGLHSRSLNASGSTSSSLQCHLL